MKLSAFLKRFNPEQRADFAVAVGTTLGHLNNVAYETRTPSAALTRAIAAQSAREVAEWELRPADWHLIWPELRGHPGAPQHSTPPDSRDAKGQEAASAG